MFSSRFDGFAPSDFKAFEQKKWSSNLYNLERLQVRERLKSLGRALANTIPSLSTFAWDVTSHTPNIFNAKKVSEMTLFFSRTEEEKKAIIPLVESKIALPEQIADAAEHHRYVCIGVSISENGVFTGVLLHSTAWLDVMNLLNRVRKQGEDFLSLLKGLPQGAMIRIGPDEEYKTDEVSIDHLTRLESNVLNNTFMINIGWRFEPISPKVGKPDFLKVCQVLMEPLVQLWHFIAWHPKSDYLHTTAQKSSKPHTEGKVLPFEEGAKVEIVHGPFEGREGIVIAQDLKGMVKVLIGRVTLKTDFRSVKLVRT